MTQVNFRYQFTETIAYSSLGVKKIVGTVCPNGYRRHLKYAWAEVVSGTCYIKKWCISNGASVGYLKNPAEASSQALYPIDLPMDVVLEQGWFLGIEISTYTGAGNIQVTVCFEDELIR